MSYYSPSYVRGSLLKPKVSAATIAKLLSVFLVEVVLKIAYLISGDPALASLIVKIKGSAIRHDNWYYSGLQHHIEVTCPYAFTRDRPRSCFWCSLAGTAALLASSASDRGTTATASRTTSPDYNQYLHLLFFTDEHAVMLRASTIFPLYHDAITLIAFAYCSLRLAR